ncbi:hypothetical protein BX661DRAFT_188295 [Kickxella alabastrina]|uniref:uncharacterized protein n=1 Tax=Kickxella alabastrina TaxID=61397 RepID=UPI002220819F|nr:uncharacterized protein BX661DRAFT_188295 [Kickxella alabastrina]KAI7821429.1 hypothetical protein BX661DRAFT_188295 [Kickxella alabastrina]
MSLLLGGLLLNVVYLLFFFGGLLGYWVDTGRLHGGLLRDWINTGRLYGGLFIRWFFLNGVLLRLLCGRFGDDLLLDTLWLRLIQNRICNVYLFGLRGLACSLDGHRRLWWDSRVYFLASTVLVLVCLERSCNQRANVNQLWHVDVIVGTRQPDSGHGAIVGW